MIPGSFHSNDVIRGTLMCGDKGCGYQTVFAMRGNATTFLPGKLLKQDLESPPVHPNAQRMIDEALKCMYGASFVGAVAMCRSAVVEQLLGKGVGKRKDNMPGLIEKAKKLGLIEAPDEVRAETAGLIAKDVLHHMGDVTEDDAMFAIRSAVIFINNVSKREPASQSGTDSNAS
jgi:hypothetical protein